MEKLPEIARRHLSCAVAVVDHPDAGLLTAFVEGTLTKLHRKELLAHLGTCAECNRLVALIAPEREVSGVMQILEVRRRWFASPVARWAGVTAFAAVLVCAIAISRIYEPIKAPSAPSAAAVKAAPANIMAQLPSTAQPNVAFSNKPLRRAAITRDLTHTSSSSQTPRSQLDADLAVHANPAFPGDVLGKDSFETSMISSALSVWSPELSKATAESADPSALQWSTSASGVLQKSADKGLTWTAVGVPSNSPLRSVKALAQNIWVGGDGGALYHSPDSGLTWTHVVLMSEGTPVSEDIVEIVFHDQSDGIIRTGNGQIWQTTDGGTNWSKR